MTKLLRLVIALVIAITLHQTASSQSLSINTDGSTADPSALLDVKSTAKGVLVPRMSKAEKNAIATPATGLLVFQNAPDSIGFHYYDGTAWLWLPAANANAGLGWLTIGNSGTDSALNFLGTLDDKPLMLRQNNLWMGQLNTKMHNYFIGGGSGFNNTAQQNTGFGDSALYNNTTGIGNTAIGYRSMLGSGPITGSVNVGIGRNSLSNISTGSQNVGIGDYAMGNMQTGGVNVIIGPGAMESASKGNSNIGLGLWALRTNDSASNNIAIGQSSLYYNDSARNIGIGYEALAYSNRDNNMAIGFQAGHLNSYLQTTDGSLGLQNTYLGYQSGYYANTGSANVAVGYHALLGQGFFNGNSPGNTFYKRNVAIGDSSMTYAYGSDNVAVGYKTLSKSTFTGRHVAVGSRALMNTVATYPNTAIGYSSQDSATTGWANTSVGSYALQNNKIGANNTAIGNAAMMEAFHPGGSNYPFDNTAVGNDALRLTRYYGHVAVGAGALRNDTSGTYNTAVGFLAMYNNKSGSWNTAVGTSALRNDTVGWVNTAVGVNAMFNHANGDNNVAMGYNALLNDIDGGANTAIGSHAMVNHKTDGLNTAVGYESMYFDSSGSLNTAMGWRSLRYNKRGSQNTALGVGAIEFTDSSFANTAVGRGAMIGAFNNTTNLAYNTVMGFYAGAYMDSVELATAIGTQAGLNNRGRENTFLGTNSGYGASGSNLTGIENTGLGTATLTYTNTGRSNTAVGMGAMYGNRAGSNNTAVGVRSMLNGQTGNNNVAVGDSTLIFNTGSNSTAVGHFALRDNTTGNFNVAVGTYSLEANTTGYRNVAIGDSAMLRNNTGWEIVAIGTESFKSNTGTAVQTVAVGAYTLSNDVSNGFNTAVGGYAGNANTTGNSNTAIGSAALPLNTTGSGNTAVGQGTMFFHLFGNSNTAIGNGSMQNDTTGANNTAVGAASLFNNRNGTDNTAIGRSAMGFNRTGIGNASLGMQSLFSNVGGSWNTAVGSYALNANIDSDGNTALGHRALNINSAGIDNVASGFYSLYTTTGSNNTGIGTYADVPGALTNSSAIGYRAYAAQSNSMVLGSINGVNGALSDTKVGIGTTTPDSTFSVADKFLVGNSGTVQFDNSVPVMNYMFKSGAANTDRMVIAHSPAFSNWGLQYHDAFDKFNFIGAGLPVLTAELVNQRVGVGTVSPQKKFHVFAGTSGATTNGNSQILMEDNTNSYLEMSTPDANENGILSSNTSGIRSGVIFASNNSLQLRSGGNTNRIYIDNAGFIGVNRVPTVGISTGTFQVQSPNGGDDIFGIYNTAGTNRWTFWTTAGDLQMFNNSIQRGTWSSVNGVYTAFSDKRLKKDITAIPVGVLAKINNLKAYSFRYNDNKSTDPLTIGFMAQDVLPFFPEAVSEVVNKDGSISLGLKYQYFGVYALKAIQEQQQIIDKQQKAIDDLLQRVEKLEKK